VEVYVPIFVLYRTLLISSTKNVKNLKISSFSTNIYLFENVKNKTLNNCIVEEKMGERAWRPPKYYMHIACCMSAFCSSDVYVPLSEYVPRILMAVRFDNTLKKSRADSLGCQP